MPGLTDKELRAIAYYAIGVGSEGKDVAYRLSFAGSHLHQKNGTTLLEPIGNSGYSVGEMQTDLGQHRDDAKALVDAYQTWAKVHHPDWVLSGQQQAQYASDLGRDGHHIRDTHYEADDAAYRAQHHTHIPSHLLPKAGADIDPTFKARLDVYLATDAGKSFVHGLDVRQVNDLMKRVAEPLENNVEFYRNAEPEEQARIFAVIAKAQNQGPTFAQHMLNDMAEGKINSLADINAKIDAFPDGPSRYMQTGRDAALAGAEVFNALQNAGKHNPLHADWQTVLADPLIDPAKLGADPARPHLVDQRGAVKALFVQQTQGRNFINALETGSSYDCGDPAHPHSRGFYVEGRDFLQWSRDGQGRAFIGGRWSEFLRDEVSLTRNPDNTLDIELIRNGQTERMLHVTHPHRHTAARHVQANAMHYGARGEAVETLQANLARLGYTGRDGYALRADGDFGRDTLHAVEALQRGHGLAVDGKVGPRTQAAIQAATEALRTKAVVASAAPAPLRIFSDPAHPQHALHATLQGLLPATTTEARLAQATAACHLAGIDMPEDLSGIYSGGNGKILFTTNSLFANIAEIDVSKPAPTVQQSLQQIRQFDQQQQTQVQHTMQQQPVQEPVIRQ